MQLNNEAQGLLGGVGDLNPLGKLQELKAVINQFVDLIKANVNQINKMYLLFISIDITIILVNKYTSQLLGHNFNLQDQFNALQLAFIFNSIAVISFTQLLISSISVETIEKMQKQITGLLIFQLILFGAGCSYMIFLATSLYQVSNPILFQATVAAKSFQFGIYNGVIIYIKSRPEFQELMKKYAEAQLQVADIQSKMKL